MPCRRWSDRDKARAAPQKTRTSVRATPFEEAGWSSPRNRKGAGQAHQVQSAPNPKNTASLGRRETQNPLQPRGGSQRASIRAFFFTPFDRPRSHRGSQQPRRSTTTVRNAPPTPQRRKKKKKPRGWAVAQPGKQRGQMASRSASRAFGEVRAARFPITTITTTPCAPLYKRSEQGPSSPPEPNGHGPQSTKRHCDNWPSRKRPSWRISLRSRGRCRMEPPR